MAQINLLKTETGPGGQARLAAGWAVKVLTAVLILILLFYGYLWLRLRSSNKSIQDLNDKVSAAQAQISANPGRDELLTRQRQLATVNGLINKHVSWSYVLPELARVTLKSSSYVSMNAENGNKLTLTVALPNYAEIDKFLQVFDLPDFNQQISDVKIVSISQDQSGTAASLRLKVEMKLNSTFITNRFQ